MDPLPSGTVTMLFSDIEGSTALLSRLGESYGDALLAQRRIMRAAIADCDGHEMGTEGDSFFVVFQAAQSAVRACVQAQQALLDHDWPQGAVVRVRMGVHTGEPARLDEGYVGMDLNRAARIAATAHGGQIVLSDATRQVVAPSLPADQSVLDLGLHRLKDIDAPERLFQFVAPGLPTTFPPLKSLGALTSLPVPATPLVARQVELADLRACILQPGTRLVTLTGPGGVGKTRLALAVAGSLDDVFAAGIFFVPLASVSNADVMWKAIAEAINAGGEQEPSVAVKDHLGDRRSLLVLDNLEQLSGAAGVVADLLTAAPQLVVVATSRRPLHLQGESEYAVPTLAAPESADVGAIAASASVTLFVQQAALVRRGFTVTEANAEDVAAICRRLDGLPLAIELAASRVKLLPPKALLARLGDSLDLAATDIGRPSRQQTLRDTIAWSFDLLSAELRELFDGLGVFSGGTDLDGVAQVACPAGLDAMDAVSELLDLSLVTVNEMADGEPRIGMLETVREYAVDRLGSSGRIEESRRRHAEYYAHFAEQARDQLYGPHQLVWVDRLEIEHDNLRAALAWSLEEPPDPGPDGSGSDRIRMRLGLRLVNALSWFWYGHGHATDGRRWLELAVAQASAEEGPDLAHAVHGLGVLLLQQGEHERAQVALEENLVTWRQLGDPSGLAKGLNSLGVAYRTAGNRDLAREALQESIAIARSVKEKRRLSTALGNLAIVEIDSGKPDLAMPLLREASAVDRELGDSWAVAVDEGNLAGAMIVADQLKNAHALLCKIADSVVEQGDLELAADTLERFAAALAGLGADTRAARLAGAGRRLRDEAAMPISTPDRALLDLALGPARARVGDESWQREYDAGRELTLSEAMELGCRPVG
ncbi:MAG: adenylate/guanylate cyclase domain-containing protein [Mycobacteriales bacterium]